MGMVRQVAVMTDPDRDQQLAYVRRIMDRLGLSQTEVAKQAGIDPSTLSRFLADDSRHLTQRTVRKLEHMSGLGFAVHAPFGSPAAPLQSAFHETDATPWRARQDEDDELAAAVAILCAGHNARDPWRLRSRALEAAGFHPGDILIVDLGMAPRPGDVVCAQVYDFAKGGAETLFRVFQPPCLIAATGDAELLRPYVIDAANVTIRGVVFASLRERARLQAA